MNTTIVSITKPLLLASLLALSACASSLQPVRPATYDFGPGALQASANDPATRPTLILGAIDAAPALDSAAVQYRLGYANVQQLKPYAQARWSMPPSLLLRQHLSEQLGQNRTLLNPGEGGANANTATLRLELEEFSQLFTTPDQSVGVIRLRATLIQSRPNGEPGVSQRSFVLQRPAPSPDAPGGVQAMAAASNAAIQAIDTWLRQAQP